MREIAVSGSYITPAHKNEITALAEDSGFTVSYYPDDAPALRDGIGRFEVLFGFPPAEWLQNARSLRWLSSSAAGVERYIGALPPGCLLTSGSGAYGISISEHILMVLLMLLRRMPEYLPTLEDRAWTHFSPVRSIDGSHCVLLGTGDIGFSAARRLRALGASVTGINRSGHASHSAFQRVYPVSELDHVLPTADVLILSLPATPETRGILSRERLALLPPSAYVVNVGRGCTIDQDALVEALQNGRLAGAALDVMMPEPLPPDHPLWDCPNTILTPHCSGTMSLSQTCDRAVDIFLRNLGRYAAGEPLDHLIDPSVGY